MKASDLFVKCLEKEGVTHIFGIPGEENADVMISLMDSKIKFVLCRHEQAAAFMADANMDRAPLICLIGQADTERLHKESHQNMDSISMFKPITKWAQSVHHPDNIPEIIRKGFKVAETEKPGAVLIELPEDLAAAQTRIKPIKP
ncbi:MAG TPA: thiamine pyrophosphate-binding protein, partial [Alphaproteobacteria bacterium]|nr:thiamine pyrophosphate-binding protein [Alphaproteobacteria bacterium]